MHGYEPGSVTPTTELVLSHKHPEDRDELLELLQRIRHNREPFSTRHRIRDTEDEPTMWSSWATRCATMPVR